MRTTNRLQAPLITISQSENLQKLIVIVSTNVVDMHESIVFQAPFYWFFLYKTFFYGIKLFLELIDGHKK